MRLPVIGLNMDYTSYPKYPATDPQFRDCYDLYAPYVDVVAAAGGLDSIVPTEGITFMYKGKPYKYTGIFAPLHQIRSILAYKK